MRVLFDTNVILDVINRREPFIQDSYKALRIAYDVCTPCVSTTTITDVVYITRKAFADSGKQKSLLQDFFSDFKILAVSKNQIKRAFIAPMTDFEDAVQAFCAKQYGAKFIITRNIVDFKLSPVTAVAPADFLRQFS